MKKYCHTLQLVDDEVMFSKYVKTPAHACRERVLTTSGRWGFLTCSADLRKSRSLFMI